MARPKLTVTADGRGVVCHAGTRLLADLADATGLATALSEVLAPLRQRNRGHDPGRVALDVALMPADGGEATADLAVLRNQHELFGPVASDPTAGGQVRKLHPMLSTVDVHDRAATGEGSGSPAGSRTATSPHS